jgi:hypothetical protein
MDEGSGHYLVPVYHLEHLLEPQKVSMLESPLLVLELLTPRKEKVLPTLREILRDA